MTSSLEKKSLIGLNEKGEKLLVKSDEEYTSTVAKIFKVISVAVKNSTSGYWNEILDLQKLHFPLKKNHEIIGRFKNQGIFFLHLGQKLPGKIIEIDFGYLNL